MQIYGGRSRKRLLPLLFLLSTSLRSQSAEVQVLGESFDVFAVEEDRESLSLLTQRILEKYPSEMFLLQRIFEDAISRRDRKGLILTLQRVFKANSCLVGSELKPKSLCANLHNLWRNHLIRVTFYDESLVKWKKAEGLIAEGKCSESLSLLREIEGREGVYLDLLESFHRAYICLKEEESVKSSGLRIERLKTLANEI